MVEPSHVKCLGVRPLAHHESIDSMTGYEGPRSPIRVMAILEALAESGGSSLTRLSETVGMPKTSLLSMLRVLEAPGYVANVAGSYKLGPLAYRLGLIIADGLKLTAMLRPLLLGLVEATNETVMLAMIDRDRGDAMYIEVLEPQVGVRLFASPGTRRPLYCTGIGRAMLAFQDAEFIQKCLSRPLTAHTRVTLTSATKIQPILEEIRTDGYAVGLGEYDPMSGAVAAPVFDRTGKVDYAINIAAPVERLRPRIKQIAKMIVPAAEEASRILGFSGAYPAGAKPARRPRA